MPVSCSYETRTTWADLWMTHPPTLSFAPIAQNHKVAFLVHTQVSSLPSFADVRVTYFTQRDTPNIRKKCIWSHPRCSQSLDHVMDHQFAVSMNALCLIHSYVVLNYSTYIKYVYTFATHRLCVRPLQICL